MFLVFGFVCFLGFGCYSTHQCLASLALALVEDEKTLLQNPGLVLKQVRGRAVGKLSVEGL